MNKRRGSVDDSQPPLKQPNMADELMRAILSVPKKTSAKLSSAVQFYVASDEISKIISYLESDEITGLNLTSKVIKLPNRNYAIAEVCEALKVPAFKEVLARSAIPHIISDHPPYSSKDPNAFLVLITGFGGVSKQADIKNRLIKQNKLLNSNNFIIARLFAKREPFTAILNLRTKALYDQVLQQEVIHVGSSAVLVYRYVNARMCMKCLQFDHNEEQCTYNVTWCAKCGAADHVIGDCKKTDKPRCRNCALRGDRWTMHMATAPNCPYRLDVLDAMAKQLDG